MMWFYNEYESNYSLKSYVGLCLNLFKIGELDFLNNNKNSEVVIIPLRYFYYLFHFNRKNLL